RALHSYRTTEGSNSGRNRQIEYWPRTRNNSENPQRIDLIRRVLKILQNRSLVGGQKCLEVCLELLLSRLERILGGLDAEIGIADIQRSGVLLVQYHPKRLLFFRQFLESSLRGLHSKIQQCFQSIDLCLT